MQFVKIHNNGNMGNNPYIAVKRFAAGMRFLHDYERSEFCERYRCALNRDIGGCPKGNAEVDKITATDRFIKASRRLSENKKMDIVQFIVLDDKSPTEFSRKFKISKLDKIYEILNAALDLLQSFYSEMENEEN